MIYQCSKKVNRETIKLDKIKAVSRVQAETIRRRTDPSMWHHAQDRKWTSISVDQKTATSDRPNETFCKTDFTAHQYELLLNISSHLI